VSHWYESGGKAGAALEELIKLEPNPGNKCFGCGGDNDHSMRLSFEQDNANRRIIGRFTLGPRYQGGGGNLHGGIIAVLLDEAMGKVCRFRNVRAVTAEMNIDFVKPIRVDQEITVEAFETAHRGRNIFHWGEIRDADGVLLARGRARFVILGEKKPDEKERAG
jgi:uncharacterized protein (TIGR00369 family)